MANTSNASASTLRFHLYYNAWRNTNSTWLRELKLSWRPSEEHQSLDCGLESTSPTSGSRRGGAAGHLTKRVRFVAPDDGNTGIDG